MTRKDTAPKKAPLWRHPAVRIGGSLLALGALVWFLPIRMLFEKLRAVPLYIWGLGLVAYLAAHLLGVVKWRMLVNAAGAGLTPMLAARAYYLGLFGTTFLPSIVGGDVVRAGMAFRHARSKSGLVLGSFLDRLLDIGSLAIVTGIGALLSPRALDAQSRRIFVSLLALMAGAGIIGLIAVALVPVGRLPFKVRRKLVGVRRAVRAAASRPWTVVAAIALGSSLQISLALLNAWLALAIGIAIPIYVWLFVWPLAKLSGLLPVTQGGIGVREAAQAALLAPFGVPAALGIASGWVFEFVMIVGGLLSGGISFLLGWVEGRNGAVRTDAVPPTVATATSSRRG